MTKSNVQIFGVIPLFNLQNNIWTAVKRRKMRCRTLICFRLTCFIVLFWCPLVGRFFFSSGNNPFLLYFQISKPDIYAYTVTVLRWLVFKQSESGPREITHVILKYTFITRVTSRARVRTCVCTRVRACVRACVLLALNHIFNRKLRHNLSGCSFNRKLRHNLSGCSVTK